MQCMVVCTIFTLSFFGIGTDLFQSCAHCWVFQICWHIECSTCTTSSFRIWNSSTGTPSLPWALYIVMLPKAQLTSHFRMSGSRWVITPSWLSGSLRAVFVQFFCVFLSPFLNIFCFHYILAFFVLYWACLRMKYALGVSNFLKVISSLSHSIISSICFHCSFKKAFCYPKVYKQ